MFSTKEENEKNRREDEKKW